MKLRRVLFVGDLRPISTCVARARGLEQLGLEVVRLDTVDWAGLSRISQILSGRLWATPSVVRMNRVLTAMAAQYRPDLIWIEKGMWVYPFVLRRLRKYARFLLHYNTDDLLGRANRFGLARRGIRQFDLHLTTNRFNVRELRGRYGRPAIRVGMGFDSELHRPPPLEAQGMAPGAVVFIGHCEPHTEKYILALRNAGVPVHVWGGAWHLANDAELRQIKPCRQEDYVPTIARSAVALCFLSRMNRNESTGRSFEIPAIGGCMLAERTREHEYLYREGEEVLFFSDAEELVRKTRRLLESAEERQRLARAGQVRCHALDLSWEGHVAREWVLVERTLAGESLHSGVHDLPFWPGFRVGEPCPPRPSKDGP